VKILAKIQLHVPPMQYAERCGPETVGIDLGRLDGSTKDSLRRVLAAIARQIPHGQTPEPSQPYVHGSGDDMDRVIRDVLDAETNGGSRHVGRMFRIEPSVVRRAYRVQYLLIYIVMSFDPPYLISLQGSKAILSDYGIPLRRVSSERFGFRISPLQACACALNPESCLAIHVVIEDNPSCLIEGSAPQARCNIDMDSDSQ
jgi:hypothetical protein